MSALIGEPDGRQDSAAAAATTPLRQFDLLGCALDARTLIEASAGTGKTWNITGLYLRLLLEKSLAVEQILVVTFTKAATAELRERIRTRIVDMLDCVQQEGASDDSFLAALAQSLAAFGLAMDDMAARLDLALQSFDQAAIYTINGFCQRALAESPFAAGMPFTTELTQDDGPQVGQAVNDFWRRHISQGGLSEEFAGLLIESRDTPEKFQKLLKRHVGKPKARIEWPADKDIDLVAMRERIDAIFAGARQCWAEHASDIRDLLNNANLKADHKPEKLAQGYKECDAYFAAGKPAKCGTRMGWMSTARIVNGTRSGQTPPAHPFFTHIDALVNELPALLAAASEALQLQRMQLLRTMLAEGSKALRECKREQRLLSYDDQLQNLHTALSDGKTPWLAQSLRERYPVALIDEFQDTDPLQFDIFSRIYHSDDAPLFLVGDPKQAIYSFRNADLHTYLQARHVVQSTTTLASNQRSSAGLIVALNKLFGTNPQAFMLPGLDYQPVQFGQKKRMSFSDPTSPAADLQVWMLPHQDGQVLTNRVARDWAAAATASEIARLVLGGAAGHIQLDGRALAPGDIAVLVRSHAQAAWMRDALAQRGVASIEISQQSVFQSSDATDVDTVLRAILEPSRQGLVLAALATPLMGCNAASIDRIAASEAALMGYVERFAAYRDTWFSQGLGFMFRQFLENEGVSRRMLRRPDGERRMTNLRHLGEALQQQQQQSASPESALRWLQAQRRDAGADEAGQLRLESDRDLVQILTIHKSKGLEYPIVFCPYLWEASSVRSNGAEGREYHDKSGELVIDFRTDKQSLADAKFAMRNESNAELLRLYYVALTRASHRCTLVAGPYAVKKFSNLSTTASCSSMLNWLAAGAGISVDAWHDEERSPQTIRQAWEQYAADAPAVLLRELGALDRHCTALVPLPDADLRARASNVRLKDDWRMSSFSGLSRGLGESQAADHDAYAETSSMDGRSMGGLRPAPQPAGEIAPDDFLLFPRGTAAGVCLHAAFELANFTDSAGWPGAVAHALERFPQPSDKISVARQQAMLQNVLANVLGADLGHGLRLSQIARHKRLVEMEFSFPSIDLRANALNTLLRSAGYAMPPLGFANLDGFLKGFIDLVFEHEGKFYLLDWKSNHLGVQPEDYRQERLRDAMAEHGYYLQHLIYTVALNRYLRLRLPGYSYEQHFGGVYYLFVRGMRPAWQQAGDAADRPGIYFDRPDAACVHAFDRMVGNDPEREAA
jgi:exodeoxyribonuclease V beta subunit